MPAGLVRTDLNTTGVDFKDGTIIPPNFPGSNANLVTWVPDPAHFSNPVPATDATFDSNPVTWVPSPAHFGNVFGGLIQVYPVFSPATNSHIGSEDITITAFGADAIYYTTDGTTPTIGSTLYTGVITVSVTTTFKAFAVKAGLANSVVNTATYTILGQTTPTFSPTAGSYAVVQNVTISSPGADFIFYTVDGSTPTAFSIVYTGPVVVPESLTIKALATKSGVADSAIGSATYTIATSFSDDLTNAGGRTTLGANWTKISYSGTEKFNANGMTSNNVTDAVLAYMSGVTPVIGNDQIASFTFGEFNLTESAESVMLGIRFSTDDGTNLKGYFVSIDLLGSELDLYYIDDSLSIQDLLNTDFSGFGVGDIISIQAVGSTISVFVNGSLIFSPVVDTRATSGTGFIAALNAHIKDFTISSL
jgi:hypothetical protein